MRGWWLALALASVSVTAMVAEPVAAQQPAAKETLTFERVMQGGLSGGGGRPPRLSPDGKLLTQLRPRDGEPERYDLWAQDLATGQWRMLVDSKKVGSGAELSEAEKMQRERARIGGLRGIVTYDWAPDGRSILVPLDGDLFLATLNGEVRRLTTSEAGELNPVISPDGGFISFVRDQNLWVQPLNGAGEARAVTQGGGGTVHWGEAEFVAQEEMSRFTGYWWSPGDKYVAVERFDEAPVRVLTRASIGAEGTKLYEQRYPLAGTPNVEVALYVMAPDGSGQVKVDLGSDPDIYLARVDWSADGKTLYVQRQNRAQTVLDMLAVDPATGKSRVLFTEKAKAKSWINLSDNFNALSDGSILWWSERSGNGHLYRFDKGRWTQLTTGDWEVADVIGVDEEKGLVYFTGNKDGVLERHAYSASLKKAGTVTRLTEPGYWNSVSMSGDRLIVARSSPSQPPQSYLADASGKRTQWLDQNALGPNHPYAPYLASHAIPEFGTLKAADGSALHYKLLKPKMEPGKRYPVFFTYYGGPGAQRVMRGWTDPLQQAIVDKGYIVFVMDNRGTANRSRAFTDQIWHAMGTVEVEDQVMAAKWLKQQPFVDPDRLVIHGWSYGGYMTLKLLEKAPGVFAAGAAVAPVTKWDLYDTHYTERYMGDPRKVPEAYARSGTLGDAGKIKDPLLVMHGMADDNVFLDNTTAMIGAMQQEGVMFDTQFYPGQTHSISNPASQLHLWNTMFDFFERRAPAKTP
ncbi:S9 family peptidase [Sphingomonas spermidinifaciens]|uniref:S9 family peptidase n=1 Tax=Sphingomonas spermidinifaciens TaxID=1141889 RepID=A0A2A4B635_9SPHN|nr:S9 family peptidase [Sphingomonas spermidinifaciens]PCD03540.1 S9 family peptidase [Sphingomonas spermidinifaciens]